MNHKSNWRRVLSAVFTILHQKFFKIDQVIFSLTDNHKALKLAPIPPASSGFAVVVPRSWLCAKIDCKNARPADIVAVISISIIFGPSFCQVV